MPTVKVSTNAGRTVLIAPKAQPGAAVTSLTRPKSGTAKPGRKKGQVTYTPDRGFAGQDRFSFRLGGVLQQVVVTVAQNRRPQARADKVSIAHDAPVTIGVMKNDTDPDGHRFSLLSVTKPKGGTATIVLGKIRYVPKQGFSGTDSFTYRLVDSEGAQEVGKISVVVAKPVVKKPSAQQPASPPAPPPPPVSPPPPPPPPPAPPSPGLNLRPYGGRFLGCTIHADAAGNHRYEYGKPAAFRFRAERSGFVKAVRWVNRRDTGTGSAHVGYSKGNGGRIRVELRNNNPATNMPGKVVLARTADLAAANVPFYAHVPFQGLASLVEGQVYHLVFIQLDASGKNSISVNMLHTKVPVSIGGNGRQGPHHGDLLAMLCSDNNEKSWRVREDRAPIFELGYTDGIACGQGWLYSHDSGAKPIGSVNLVRQRLELVSDVTVMGVWLRLRKLSNPTTLEVLLRQDERLVGRIAIDPGRIVTSTRYDRAVPWQYYGFGERLPLKGGRLYDLQLQSNQGNYWISATQRGQNWGYNDRNLPRPGRGCAEFSEDGGRTWQGWTFTSESQGAHQRRDMDLTAALVLA